MIIQTAISVSALNVVFNIIVIVLAHVAGILANRALRNLVLLRLHKNGTEPIYFEEESRLNQFTSMLRSSRYIKSPTMVLVTLLSTALLLIFEIGSESGLDSSSSCRPQKLITQGLCATPYKTETLIVKELGAMLYTQKIKWNEDDLVSTPIRQGFRKNFNGKEVFDPRLSNRSLPIIVANCSVADFRIHARGTLYISIQNTKSIWSFVMSRVQFVSQSNSLSGYGDQIFNPSYLSAFNIIGTAGGLGGAIKARVFEYSNSEQLVDIASSIETSRNYYAPKTQSNKTPLLSYEVKCSKNILAPHRFANALRTYRTTQLESSIKLHPIVEWKVGNESVAVAKPMSAADVVKATIALKASDMDECEGETWVYSTCGVYDFLYIMPVIGTILILCFIVGMTEYLVRKRKAYVKLPISAYSWFCYAWKMNAKSEEEQCPYKKSSSKELNEKKINDEDPSRDINAELCLMNDSSKLTLQMKN